MSNNITRLVLGESQTLSLGIPVSQTVRQKDVSKTLRFRDGRWEGNPSLIAKVKQVGESSSSMISIPTFAQGLSLNRNALIGLVIASVLMLAWFAPRDFKQYMNPQEVVQPLPFAVKAMEEATRNGVRTVDEPFVMPVPQAQLPALPVAASQAGDAPGAQGVIPQIPATTTPFEQLKEQAIEQPKPKEPPKPKEQAKEQPKPKETPKQALLPAQKLSAVEAQKNEAKDQPLTKALIVDDDVEKPKAPAQATPAPVASQLPAKPATPPAAKRGEGLVAVTPDGKYGVFTNPKTRLPEKFGVGDKLQSGETIKSIDASGKVVTDVKEYRLE